MSIEVVAAVASDTGTAAGIADHAPVQHDRVDAIELQVGAFVDDCDVIDRKIGRPGY